MFDNIYHDFPAYPVEGAYLDNSTIGLQANTTINSQIDYLQKIGNTVRKGLYKRSRMATEAYFQAKETWATYFSGSIENYAWIPNSDFGWNMIINSLIHKNKGKKLKVITSAYEHHSLLAPLIYWKKKGEIDLRFLGLEDEFNLQASINSIADEHTTIALSHVSPIIGVYRDISTLCAAKKATGAILIVDYSRSAGQNKINFHNDPIDAAIIDGSIDLLGPQSAGILYLGENMLADLQNAMPGSGGVRYVTLTDIGQLRNIERFETGNPNIAGMIGLSASLTYLRKLNIENIMLHRINLQNYLIKRLNEIQSVKLVDPLLDTRMGNPNRSSIVTFNFGEISSHDVALLLDETFNVEVRSGLICSHPGLDSLGIEEVIQVSSHIYNSKKDIDLLIDGLDQIQAMFI